MMWVLLDMDGTLTGARQPLGEHGPALAAQLLKLRGQGVRVGIVTGSGLGYMRQQLSGWWGAGVVDAWAPCNGTQLWMDGDAAPTRNATLLGALGQGGINDLLAACVSLQSEFMAQHPHLPYTSTFVQRRTALVNWCPIGRDAGPKERTAFVEFDSGVRHVWLRHLQSLLPHVLCTLGGATSFDVMPHEYSKVHALEWAGPDPWFIGDAMGPGGNDQPLARLLGSRALQTSGPAETLRLLQRLAVQNG